MARVKNRKTAPVLDLRALVLADLIEYRDAITARYGPDSFQLVSPGFRRIATLEAGLTVSVRGFEVTRYVPPGSVDDSTTYQLTPDNRLIAL